MVYYGRELDVHPLAQLAAAGFVFGAGIAWGKWQEAKEERQRHESRREDDEEEAADLADSIEAAKRRARGAAQAEEPE